jgi:DNA-binding NarL/FixJ family response regulator
MSQTVLRILMADDHPIVLAGLKALVQADPGLEIVGEARDGRTAQRLALSLRPDVIVMDISMPEMNGVEVARALLAEQPGPRILMLTVHEDRATLRQLLDLGVAGYLVKRSAADELPRAIRAVAAGGTYLDPAIAGKAVGSGGQGNARAAGGAGGGVERAGDGCAAAGRQWPQQQGNLRPARDQREDDRDL